MTAVAQARKTHAAAPKKRPLQDVTRGPIDPLTGKRTIRELGITPNTAARWWQFADALAFARTPNHGIDTLKQLRERCRVVYESFGLLIAIGKGAGEADEHAGWVFVARHLAGEVCVRAIGFIAWDGSFTCPVDYLDDEFDELLTMRDYRAKQAAVAARFRTDAV